jgi:hypothetical protein
MFSAETTVISPVKFDYLNVSAAYIPAAPPPTITI